MRGGRSKTVQRGLGGRHRLGTEKKRGSHGGQRAHFNQDQVALEKAQTPRWKACVRGSGQWGFRRGGMVSGNEK